MFAGLGADCPLPWISVLGCPKVTHREESEAKWGDQANQKPCDEGPKGSDQHLPSHTHHSQASQGGILDLNLMEQDMLWGTGSMESISTGLGGEAVFLRD